MRDRSMVRPTARGTAVAIAGVLLLAAAWWTGLVELQFAGVVALVAVLAAVLLTVVQRPRIGVRRGLDRELTGAGTPIGVHLTIENRRRMPLPAGRLVDRFDDPAAESEGVAGLSTRRIAAGGTLQLDYTVRAAGRGEHRIGPVRMTITDPFGLAVASHRLADDRIVVVSPAVVPLEEVAFEPPAGAGSADRRRPASDRTTRDVIAREYRAGDPLRHVHWRASAHHGELMVRQEDVELRAHAVLVVDRRLAAYRTAAERAAHPGAGARQRATADRAAADRLDWATAALASLAAHLDARGVAFVLVDGSPAAPSDAGEPLESVLERLGRLVPATDADASGPFAAAAAVVAADPAPVFAVAGLVEPSDREQATALLARARAGSLVLPGHDPVSAAALRDQGWLLHEVGKASRLATVWAADPDAGVPSAADGTRDPQPGRTR